MNTILASASPRRRELLKNIIPKFDVTTANINETIDKNDVPPTAVMSLAYRKAYAVAITSDPQQLIIGADTMVYLEGYLGKPKDEVEAKAMLNRLSGKWHSVYTGVAMVQAHTNKKRIFYSKTNVLMSQLSISEINAYVASKAPLDKAGAYGIQGLGAKFIERISGDYYTVMGLPVQRLYHYLKHEFSEFLLDHLGAI